jgi:hypothetical protein
MSGTLFLDQRQKPGPKPHGLSKSDRLIIFFTLALTVGISLYFRFKTPRSDTSAFSLAQTEIVWEARP